MKKEEEPLQQMGKGKEKKYYKERRGNTTQESEKRTPGRGGKIVLTTYLKIGKRNLPGGEKKEKKVRKRKG